jgi:hypothetical protein
MDRYEGPHTALTIAMHRGLYLAIIIDRYEGPHTALTIALHISINNSRVPDDWKSAILVPIYKAGDKGDVNNYRPVSLTSVCVR